MTELKPCPFCGGTNVNTSSCNAMNGDFRKGVYCSDCDGAISPYKNNVEEAIKAWNTRAERTCRDFGGEEGTNGEGYDFACTACGFCCDQPEPNYCPNCGAKVVDE